MTKAKVFAPAKINLALHITGQRHDGYHLVDSIVGFAGVGDSLLVERNGTGLVMADGPEASGLPLGPDNLITRQAAAISEVVSQCDVVLQKHLPISSGIGGGSADAAAFYRAAAALTEAEHLMAPDKVARQWQIGADIPMCILSMPARVSGIGERIDLLPTLPEFPIVLVNPRVPVPTSGVFSALQEKTNPPVSEDWPSDDALFDWIAWLDRQRNDLEAPAIAKVPMIARVLDALQRAPECALARMSGSGATCFGLFETDEDATAAEQRIAEQNPGWWVRATRLNGHLLAEPQVIRSTT